MPRNFGELPGKDAGTLGAQPLQDFAAYHASVPVRPVGLNTPCPSRFKTWV
jgi:hypothetical protein